MKDRKISKFRKLKWGDPDEKLKLLAENFEPKNSAPRVRYGGQFFDTALIGFSLACIGFSLYMLAS